MLAAHKNLYGETIRIFYFIIITHISHPTGKSILLRQAEKKNHEKTGIKKSRLQKCRQQRRKEREKKKVKDLRSSRRLIYTFILALKNRCIVKVCIEIDATARARIKLLSGVLLPDVQQKS